MSVPVPAEARFARDLLQIAGVVTGIALFVAAGVALHRWFRPYSVPGIVWSYLLNGIAVALLVLVPPSHSQFEVPPSPIVSYALGVAGAAFMIVIWPLAWFWLAVGSLMSGSLGLMAGVVIGPFVLPAIRSAVAGNVSGSRSQPSARPDTASATGDEG